MLTALRFIAEVREVALEHNFVTLRKNYRGYEEPDDYSMQWNLVMEEVRFTFFFFFGNERCIT